MFLLKQMFATSGQVAAFAFVGLMFSQNLVAGYKGEFVVTEQEIADHRATIDVFESVAATCLEAYKAEHIQFYKSHCHLDFGYKICLSKFYGERRYSKEPGKFRPDGTPLVYLADELIKNGYPVSMMNQMQANSCVGMAMDCLSEAFAYTGQSAVWEKLKAYTKANGVGGLTLQDGLARLGWKTLYWNPAPLETIKHDVVTWDEQELNWASKGHHKARYESATKKGTYWFNKVDDASSLVGFGSAIPSYLEDIKFWVGTAHTGYHVFPGTGPYVVEAHSTRSITAEDNLEFSVFSPFLNGGGPRWTKTEKYRSGLIVVPPKNN